MLRVLTPGGARVASGLWGRAAWCAHKHVRSVGNTEIRKGEGDERDGTDKTHGSADIDEVHKFSRLSGEWWNPHGTFGALQTMNSVRVRYLVEHLPHYTDGWTGGVPGDAKPLEGLQMLDVGSGGGIFAEPLARLGAQVLGVDASEECVTAARMHAEEDPFLDETLAYRHATAEDLVAEGQAFDAVLASEIIEHVRDPAEFLKSCAQLVKPGGCLFVSTISRTLKSLALACVAAERILRLVPPGTHEWGKFITPVELILMLEDVGLNTQDIQGVAYNPLLRRWSFVDDKDINYMLLAKKEMEQA
eukprot:TRINITY_DN22133_c0_g1_i2.p2 TRINITY_DN22133_c0_g1~~TRINITY_DN22133_c0_g1_i2.p2  ORF type:complete len:304 (-),score=58.88 TRINITY_DN22133_c0_g1_i2:1416-2327(-)